MPLYPGTRLGPYEVVAAIGAGGMSACGPTGARRGARGGRSEWGWGPIRPGEKKTDLAHSRVRRWL